MNSRERIEAVVALETPDRTPVGPLLDHFAATHAGITKALFMHDRQARRQALLKGVRDFGPWDLSFLAETVIPEYMDMAPARVKFPGLELPEDETHQFEEFELLTPEDYETLLRLGFHRFLIHVAKRVRPNLSMFGAVKNVWSLLTEVRRNAGLLRKQGVEPAVGFMIPGPLFEYFSLGRSMGKMCLDLFDFPDRVKTAGHYWARAICPGAARFAKLAGIPRVFIGLSRSSPALISPQHFEEFVLDELIYMVNDLIGMGITPLLHMDTDWTRSLHYFTRLPPKKCIIELDGATDIFKAKQILGGHSCLMGDVPAYLLAFGRKDEVMAYCKRLIQEVGRDGGFILSSGCSIPANAKPSNVKALAEAAAEWGEQKSWV